MSDIILGQMIKTWIVALLIFFHIVFNMYKKFKIKARSILLLAFYIALHCFTLHYLTLHYLALLCIDFCCFSLFYTTLHCLTLFFITFIILHYTFLHYISINIFHFNYLITHYKNHIIKPKIVYPHNAINVQT